MSYSSVRTVKAWLGIPESTSTEDDAVSAALSAADAQIDNLCGRSFDMGAAVATRAFSPVHPRLLRIDDLAQLDDLVVKVDTTDDGLFDTTLTTADFFVAGNFAPYREVRRAGGSWPRPLSTRPSVQIEGWWGYAETVPDPVVQASTMLAGRFYQRRSSPLGLQAGMVPEAGAMHITRSDSDVRALLTGYRLPAVA